MAREPEYPRWAFVVWPDATSLSCIPIDQVMVATMRDAILIADERWVLPLDVVEVEPSQSNPRRTDDDG